MPRAAQDELRLMRRRAACCALLLGKLAQFRQHLLREKIRADFSDPLGADLRPDCGFGTGVLPDGVFVGRGVRPIASTSRFT